MRLPVLKGNLIQLVPLDIDAHAVGYYNLSQDEKMHLWTGNNIPSSVENVKKLLTIYQSVMYNWVIINIETSKLIGIMRISFPKDANGVLSAGDSQFLHSDFWRKGYMKEARRLVYDYVFNTLHVDRLIADVRQGNTNSIKSLQSVGYRLYNSEPFYCEKYNRTETLLYFELKKDVYNNES